MGSSFDIYYFIKGAKKSDIRTFRETLLRFYVYIVDHVPFITIAYFGTSWYYDTTLNILGRDQAVIDAFFQEGNVVNLFLIDAEDNTLLAGRMIGLPDDAVQMIKTACREQLNTYSNMSEVDGVISRVYATYDTRELMKMSKMYEFKR